MFSSKPKRFLKNHLILSNSKKIYTKPVPQDTFFILSSVQVFITAGCLHTCLKLLKKLFRTRGKIYLEIYPDFSATTKPKEIRMGKGKGLPEIRGTFLLPGQPLFKVVCFSSHDSFFILHQLVPVLKKIISGVFIRKFNYF